MSGTDPYPAVLLFLKAPVPGFVKTRLAREVGDELACGIYRLLVQQQLAALPDGWPVEIHFSPASARADFVSWLGPTYDYHPQPEGDLGTRLRMATADAFARGHEQVVLIGGDCPALGRSDFEQTAGLWGDGADVVIGPAIDGGYYLLGLRAAPDPACVFDDIPWSTSDVGRVTMERVAARGLRLARLEEKEDVDDLGAYSRAVQAGHFQGQPVL